MPFLTSPVLINFSLLSQDTLEQFGCRFVVRILRDEFAADGEVEDGLAELLDVFGARGEAREVAEVKAGVLAELVGIRAVVQSMRDAAASLSRRLSLSPCIASNRSHSAINSFTLATMRCCSARGESG